MQAEFKFNEFKEQIMEDLKAYLPGKVGEEVTIFENRVEKLQSESYEGLVIKKDSANIGINLNIESLYSALNAGKSYEDVFGFAIDITLNGLEGAPAVDINRLMDYEAMKQTLMLQLIPVKGNEEMLKDMPYQQIEDLAVVYRFSVGRNECGIASMLVKNEHLDRYGITKEQLFADAELSAPKLDPATIRPINEVIAEMMGEDFDDFPPYGPMLYVASNVSKIHGAAVLVYPGFLDYAAEVIGGSFYVLPSSVHELLLMVDDGDVDVNVLESMIQEVNESSVAPNEQLSCHPYHYDVESKVFELAEKFANR